MARKHAHLSFSAQTTPHVTSAPSCSPFPKRKTKKLQFKKWYNTANTSDTDVLGNRLAHLIGIQLTSRKEKQKHTWKSPSYDHYNAPEIVRDGALVKYVFVCKRYVSLIWFKLRLNTNMSPISSHPSIKVSRAWHDESISNLVRHADGCDPSDSATSHAMASFAQGSTYLAPKLWIKLALWVV